MREDVIICGDALDVLPTLADEVADIVIVDPPYASGGRDGSVHLCQSDIAGNRMSTDSHVWWTRQYASLLLTKTKADSHCYVFSDWRKYKDVQIAFETVGWELRALLVWDKGNGMGEFWRSSHEFILFLTKRQPRKLTHGGCFNVLRFPPLRGKAKVHPAQKPLALMEYLIEASSREGDVVLDCFAGSGVVAEACVNLGRHYILIEQQQKWCDTARQRLQQNKLPLEAQQ